MSTNSQAEVVFAVDYSGSTGGCSTYWETVERLYNETCKEVPKDKVVILMWDHDSAVYTPKQLQETITNRTGHGGTNPEQVARFVVKNNFTKKLVLITDGQVWGIEETEKALQKHPGFTMVECHIVADGSHNLSVSCPFTRKLNSFVYTHTGSTRKLVISITQETHDLVYRLHEMSVDEFVANYEAIEGYVMSQNMGRAGNTELRDLILKEKTRLLYEWNKKQKITAQLEEVAVSGDLARQTSFLRLFVDDYFKNLNEISFEDKINKLVELCGDCRRVFDVAQVRSNRAKRAKVVETAEVAQVKAEAVEEAQKECVKMLVECPMSGEQDVPVVLFCAENILDGIPSNVANDIINSPLRLVNYPALVQRIKAALGGVIGLKTLKETQMAESPLTGAPLCGGLPLASTDATKKVLDFAVAKLFTRQKLLGSPVYYLIALYEVIKEDEQYQEIIPAFQQLLVARIKTMHTFAGMSGKPQYVSTLIRCDLAMWFILHSCLLDLPPTNNPLLLHVSNIPVFIDMLRLVGLPIAPEVLAYLDRLIAATVLHRMAFINQDVSNNIVSALYQNAIPISKQNISAPVLSAEYFIPYILVDGPAQQQQVDAVLAACNPALSKCSVPDLARIALCVHKSFGQTSVVLPFAFTTPPPTPSTLWDGMQTGSFTLDVAAMKRKFAAKYKKTPNRDEFLLFLSRRVPVATLPVALVGLLDSL